MHKKIYYLVVLLVGMNIALTSAQRSITIEECREMAEAHYPALARYDIIEKTKHFNIENANKAYLPQGTLSAQATWQSDVTRFNVDLPEGFPPIEIPIPDQDQYKVVAELSQLIWDGGRIPARKKSIQAGAEAEKRMLESEIYPLRERVHSLYFGILLMKEHLQQQEILEKELQRNWDNVSAYVRNGLANDADISAVKVEQLKAGQQRIQLEANLEAYMQMLSVLTGTTIDSEMTFVKPLLEMEGISPAINRPELKLFDAQIDAAESQRSLLNADMRPIIAAFAQGGYGKPGLNMFDNQFSPYFAGGIRLSWNFGNLYTLKNDKRKIALQKESILSQKETFLHNLHMQIPQQQIEIDKFKKTMRDDDEIIRHRKVIRQAAEAKVENGTMTVSDLMKEINAEEAAKQAKTLHEIQYLLSIYALKYTTN